MAPKLLHALRAWPHTGNALLVVVCIMLFTVAGIASSTRMSPRSAPAASPAPSAASPVRAPRAKPQSGDSNKAAALERENQLLARNAADAVRAAEIRVEIEKLEKKLDGRSVSRKKRAKLGAMRGALMA